MSSPSPPSRSTSFGGGRSLNPLDRTGIWLRSLTLRRHVDVDGARFGDFGCGFDATVTRSVIERISSAVLVDLQISPELKRNPKVTAHEGSIEEVLPRLETGSLDAVICLAVLEHLWDAQEPLREFHRVLAPGGTLLVNVPSWRAKPVLEFVSFRLGLAADEMDDHKHYYDPRDLWPLLVEAGFMPSAIRCGRHNLGFGTFAVCRTPAA